MTTQESTVGLSRIGQISVNVHDIARSVKFYRDTLGMKFLFEVPNMAFFDCGGIRLMLSIPEKPEYDHPGSIIYYKVADIQATARQLTSRGVSFDAPPHFVAKLNTHDLWLGFFHDQDGNILALMSEVAHA